MAYGRHGRSRREPTHEVPEDIMGMFRVMTFVMREQVVAAYRMMERLDRQGEGGNLDRAKVDLEYLKFLEFRKANPLMRHRQVYWVVQVIN